MRRGWIVAVTLLILTTISVAQPTDTSSAHPRMQIALLELDVNGGLDTSLARPLSDRLRQELFKTGEFTVVERNVMEAVLEEQSLHLAGCTSNECAVEVGRILGVQQIVAGSVSRVGIYLTISARLIDVETTEVTAAESIDCECTLEEVLTKRLQDLAAKLAQAVEKPDKNQDMTLYSESGSDFSDRNGDSASAYRDDTYHAEFPPAVHRVGSKAAVWMEKAGIGAVNFQLGWTAIPVDGSRWVGSLGNGLTLQFPATRQFGWFHPEIQLTGGSIRKEKDGIFNTATLSGVYFRAYSFTFNQRAEKGFYAGAGIGLLSRTEVVTSSPANTLLGGSTTTLRGEIGLEGFVGSQFDLNWDVGGRKLFTFLELRTEVMPVGDSPTVRVSVQTGLGWKLDTFTR